MKKQTNTIKLSGNIYNPLCVIYIDIYRGLVDQSNKKLSDYFLCALMIHVLGVQLEPSDSTSGVILEAGLSVCPITGRFFSGLFSGNFKETIIIFAAHFDTQQLN